MVTAARTCMVTSSGTPTSHRMFATTAQTRPETVWEDALHTPSLVRFGTPLWRQGYISRHWNFSPNGPRRPTSHRSEFASIRPQLLSLQEADSDGGLPGHALGAQTCFCGAGIADFRRDTSRRTGSVEAPPKFV